MLNISLRGGSRSLPNLSRDSRKSIVEHSAVMPSLRVLALLHSLGRYLLAMFDLSTAVPSPVIDCHSVGEIRGIPVVNSSLEFTIGRRDSNFFPLSVLLCRLMLLAMEGLGRCPWIAGRGRADM